MRIHRMVAARIRTRSNFERSGDGSPSQRSPIASRSAGQLAPTTHLDLVLWEADESTNELSNRSRPGAQFFIENRTSTVPSFAPPPACSDAADANMRHHFQVNQLRFTDWSSPSNEAGSSDVTWRRPRRQAPHSVPIIPCPNSGTHFHGGRL
jgi:hypothetical protein